MFALAACADTTTSPRETLSATASSGPAFDFSGGGSRQFGDQASDFTVTSQGGSFSVNGLVTLNFPANSVCNPNRSSYGSTEWDKPCSTLASGESIKITAKIRLTSNGVAADFSPELRFSPSTQVTVSSDIFAHVLTSNRNYFLSNPSSLSFLAIGFSPSLGGTKVADYVTDKSLITHVNLGTGTVWRRVKHFSGYAIGSVPCVPSLDVPECVWVDGDGITGP